MLLWNVRRSARCRSYSYHRGLPPNSCVKNAGSRWVHPFVKWPFIIVWSKRMVWLPIFCGKLLAYLHLWFFRMYFPRCNSIDNRLLGLPRPRSKGSWKQTRKWAFTVHALKKHCIARVFHIHRARCVLLGRSVATVHTTRSFSSLLFESKLVPCTLLHRGYCKPYSELRCEVDPSSRVNQSVKRSNEGGIMSERLARNERTHRPRSGFAWVSASGTWNLSSNVIDLLM